MTFSSSLIRYHLPFTAPHCCTAAP
eukprot:SAG11_NODE_17388_length_520_cov_0.954869_2_plen_24_part_01